MALYVRHRKATRSFTVLYPVLLLLSLSAPAQERISGSAAGDVVDDAAAAGALVSVEVADQNERSVADAEVMLLTDDLTVAITEGWIGGKEGRIDIRSGDLSRLAKLGGGDLSGFGQVKVLTRAPGQAWGLAPLALPAQHVVRVLLPESVELRAHLKTADGRALPDVLAPVVASRSLLGLTWSRVLDAAEPERATAESILTFPSKVGEGVFAFPVPAHAEELFLLLHCPGFLECYQSDAIEDVADGVLQVDLPAPGSISVHAHPHDQAPAEYAACGVSLRATPGVDSEGIFPIENRFSDGKQLVTTFECLAPGRYMVETFTGTRDTMNDQQREDYFMDIEHVEVKPGRTSSIDVAIRTFDEEYYRRKLKGDQEVVVEVNNPDGTPAAGKPYRAYFIFRHFGLNFTGIELPVAEGRTSPEGLVRLRNLAPMEGATLIVWVDEHFIGRGIAVTEDAGTTIKYTLPD